MSYYKYIRGASAGLGLYNQLRRTRRRKPRRTRRTSVYARTRRRGYRRKPNPATYRGSKILNMRRQNVALPKLEKKLLQHIYNSTQYSAFGANDWSAMIPLNTVAQGTTNMTRESNNIKFLAKKNFKLVLEQLASTEHDYRIMLIKQVSKTDHAVYPTYMLANYTYPMNCSYRRFQLKTGNTVKLICLKDIKFRWNTDPAKGSTRKTIKLNIPASNVQYDEDVSDGTDAVNRLFLCVYSDCPTTNSDYTFSCWENMYFLDQ